MAPLAREGDYLHDLCQLVSFLPILPTEVLGKLETSSLSLWSHEGELSGNRPYPNSKTITANVNKNRFISQAKGKITNLGLPYTCGRVLLFHRLGYDLGGFPRSIPFGKGHPRWYPLLIRGSQGVAIVGNIVSPHHSAPLGFPQRLLPSNNSGRMLIRGKYLPPPTRGAHQSKFINMFILPYINIILLADSKSVRTKLSEIK